MKRPCSCMRVTGPVYRGTDCRLCWLAYFDPRYRKLWGTGGPADAAKPRLSVAELVALKRH